MLSLADLREKKKFSRVRLIFWFSISEELPKNFGQWESLENLQKLSLSSWIFIFFFIFCAQCRSFGLWHFVAPLFLFICHVFLALSTCWLFTSCDFIFQTIFNRGMPININFSDKQAKYHLLEWPSYEVPVKVWRTSTPVDALYRQSLCRQLEWA